MSSRFLRPLVLAALVAAGIPAVLPARAAVTVSAAPKSSLPLPPQADVWWDAQGTPTATAPGVQLGAVESLRVVIFRPKGDNLTWAQFTQLYVDGGILQPAAKVEFSALSVPRNEVLAPGAVLNAKETNVYRTRAEGEFLVLGLIRNLRSNNQLAYAVVLKGAGLDNPQALVQAQSLVEVLAEKARVDRMRLAPPPGARPVEAEMVLTGPQIGQLNQSIQRSPLVSLRVKEMAQQVIPRARLIRLGTWQTPAPMPDEAFFNYFTQQAQARGWDAPSVKDATAPGRPTLLFNRPDRAGVVMVRAQQTPLTTGRRPATVVFILEIEGTVFQSR